MSHTDLMRGRWLWTVVICALIGAGATVWLVARRHHRPAPRKPEPAEAVQVKNIRLSGKLGAQHVVAVAAPVEGVIDQFLVEVGQEVLEGQLLGRVRSEGLEGARDAALLELQRAQDKVNADEARLTSARLEASRTGAVALSARVLAERAGREYQRQSRLNSEGATPRLVYERAQVENERASGDWQSAQRVADQAGERVTAMTNELTESKKLLQEKTQTVDQSKEHLAAGEVVSPVSGILVGRHGEPGGQVNPSVANLFEIGVDTALLEVHLEAAPDVLRRVTVGGPAIVQVLELGMEPIRASVKEVTPAGIVVTFVSPTPLLKPGLTAQVTIEGR